ncbi:MAG: DUF1565 domain-containing protein [Archangiaceae bacterium]|nr:DUF1565 domain-containing protein [Archangiaceae bacterium]
MLFLAGCGEAPDPAGVGGGSAGGAAGGSAGGAAGGSAGGAAGGSAGGTAGGSAGGAAGGSAGGAAGGSAGGAAGGSAGGAAGGSAGGAAGGSGGMVAGALYVATTGSDSAPGTQAQPFRTVDKGLSSVAPGQTLYIRGGTYVENVSGSLAGSATHPITVRNYPGERPVISGLLWLNAPDYVTIDGINVTWNSSNSASQHMVKMSGGRDWALINSELWGARSFAGLLISGGAQNFRVAYNSIHDTQPSPATNQDHLIYANQVDGGIIERNLLYNSANGRGVKIGNVGGSTGLPRNLVVRYNTFYNNLGPSNLQVSYSANGCQVYRNIMVKSSAQNVTAFSLTGTGNEAHDNVGFESSGVVDTSSPGLTGSSNLAIDPHFVNAAGADFHPTNSAAAAYGRYAP